MKKVLPVAALLTALMIASVAGPAVADSSSTEVSFGPTMGFAGPGLAFRHFPHPTFGYQVGANSWGITHFAGAALLYSPNRSENGERTYLQVGGAVNYNNTKRLEFIPAVGVGASGKLGEHWTLFGDVSLVQISLGWGGSSGFLLPSLQGGILYTF